MMNTTQDFGQLSPFTTEDTTMTAAEIKAVKDFSTHLMNEILPELIQEEIKRLPAFYGMIVGGVVATTLPMLKAALDTELAKLKPSA